MNSDNLKRGNEISQSLKKLQEEKVKWEKLQSEKKVYSEWTIHGGNGSVIQSKYIDLDVMFAIGLVRINKEIAELEEEFKNL